VTELFAPNLTRRTFLCAVGTGAMSVFPTVARLAKGEDPPAGAPAAAPSAAGISGSAKPNFVIIFTDDQGYQDIGCFGSKKIRTPRLDRMAAEGMRFTSFYAQTVCGPSRAALLHGCYPLRVATKNNRVEHHPRVHIKEINVAKVLKAAGYASAAFGKWDNAGHSQTRYEADLMPTKKGFDYFFGTPESNDGFVNLIRNGELVEERADMAKLTELYTDEAIGFMRANRDKPFLVYLAHTMPHTKLAASKKFLGKSARGLYGDVVEEIDFNVGRVLDTVKELGLDERTYVIFCSDNGPWYKKGPHGGCSLPLRGAKTSVWEGGLRVPCIMRAPGRIPAGTVCDEVASTMDLLPTLAKLASAKAPTDRVIDGHDISALMHGEKGATSPTKAFYYYQQTHLQAVRSGKWKLHLAHPTDPNWELAWVSHVDAKDVLSIKKPMLFDLEADIGETTDVADKHPDVVTRLTALADWAREDIGDYNRIGKNARFFDSDPKRPDIQARANRKGK